jgi:NhaP-type Na+/H+ or K+/H+ antiporter
MELGWFLLIGAVLVVMAFASHLVERLPLSSAIIYLGAGVVAGPAGINLIQIHPLNHAALLEALAEIAMLITLFAVGLQLRLPSTRTAWRVPVRLAGAGVVARPCSPRWPAGPAGL